MANEFNDVNAMLDDIKVSTDAGALRLGAVGVAITAQAARLQSVIDVLKQSGGMTATEKAALAAKVTEIKSGIEATNISLDDEVAILEATGVDPANPTPDPAV